MRYAEILTEKAMRLTVDGRPVTVLENPMAQQIVTLLERSSHEVVKGLIIGSNVFFWDATYATHGHIAEHIFPTDGKRVYWEYPEYNDGRLVIEDYHGHPTLDFDPDLLLNPRILQLLKSDLIYFNVPGAGHMNYSEMLRNDAEMEKRDQARRARMQAVQGAQPSL